MVEWAPRCRMEFQNVRQKDQKLAVCQDRCVKVVFHATSFDSFQRSEADWFADHCKTRPKTVFHLTCGPA